MRFIPKVSLTLFYLYFVFVGVFIYGLIPRRFTEIGSFDLITLYLHFMALFSLVVFFTRCVIINMYLRTMIFLGLVIILLIEIWIWILTQNPGTSIMPLLHKFEVIMIYLVLSNLVFDITELYLRRILAIIAVSMLFAIFYSLYGVQINAYVGGGLRLLSGGEFARASSPIGGPNLVGLICAASIPYALHYKQQKSSWLLVTIIFLIATILTSSKTSFIAALAGLGSYYILSKDLRRIKVYEIVTIVLSLALMLFAMTKTRINTLFDSLDAGGSNRLEVWREAIFLANSKLFGWGTDYWINSDAPFSAHNLWLEMVLDYGWIRGLIAWVILLILLFHILRIGLANRQQGGAALASSIVALFVASLGDYHFWEPRVLLITTVLTGIGISSIRGKRNEVISRNE